MIVLFINLLTVSGTVFTPYATECDYELKRDVMKKLMIAMAILGMTYSYAEAQTCNAVANKTQTNKVVHVAHKAKTIKTAGLYQVCREEGGYYTCCVHKNTTTIK